ncbi:hypothetical protein E1176_15010 [Fulvivirga sp. RKSG066]|nr:hypothetical protein [Fulvivirga aurantia]
MTDIENLVKLAAMKKVAFVVNSLIKEKKKFLKDLKRATDTYDFIEFLCHETSTSKDAIKISESLAKTNIDCIVAVGGDGTLNEVVNGVTASNFEGLICGLAYGTGNDFCKTLPFPSSISELVEWLDVGYYKQLCVGKINYQNTDGDATQRHFINIADLGIGAQVVQRVSKDPIFINASLTFTKAIIQTFLSYKNQAVKVEADNWLWEGKINSLVIANGKYFGSGLCIAPDADPSKARFDIVISGDISIRDYLKNIPKIKRGAIIKHPQLFYKTAKSIKVSGVESPCGIECDGEFLGTTPVEITLADQKINFLTKKSI